MFIIKSIQDNFISDNFIIPNNNPMDNQLFDCYL